MNACHRTVYSPVNSCWLSKNMNMETHSNTIVRVVLYGCGTWSMENRSSVCGNVVNIGLQKTNNERLRGVYEMGRACGTHGGDE